MSHKTTKIINLFGGPNTGKTTTAAGLFYLMRLGGMSCELVTEFNKELIYDGQEKLLSSQLYPFAQQERRQSVFEGKTDYIITDHPLLLDLYFSSLPESHSPKGLDKVILSIFKKQNNINILLVNPKGKIPYQREGRNRTKKQALQDAKNIKDMLDKYKIPYYIVENSYEDCNLKENCVSKIFHMLKLSEEISKPDRVKYLK